MKGQTLGMLVAVVILAILGSVGAERFEVLEPRTSRCFGMYSRASVPGTKTEPFIRLNVTEISGEFAYLVFDSRDQDSIGYKDPETGQKYILCTEYLFEKNKCLGYHVGEFIVNTNVTNTSMILHGTTKELAGDDDLLKDYPIMSKGFYCVVFSNTTHESSMSGNLQTQNPYGNLPAEIYPYLPFYGFVGLAYLVVGLLWLVLCACYWKDILQVQVYITGIIFLCMIEMTMQYAYYANYNDDGISSNALLAIAVILNSARNSVAFVALLVVCMGYGLVKPTLGTTARKVLGLGFSHFIFGTLFAASTMLQTASSQKILALLFVFPLAVTLTLFYSWTFNSLTVTLKKLEVRRQTAKILVYKRLWRLLLFSIVVLMIFLVLTIIQRYDDNYQREHWDSLWFTTDGWIHLLFFFVFLVIIFLWRPTNNNSRYSMVEVPQDDDDEEQITTGGSSHKIKMRGLKKKKGSKDEEEEDDDALQWVEENISDSEDPGPLTLEEEDEAKIARREMAKMN